jgi:putative DNA primase/helicase
MRELEQEGHRQCLDGKLFNVAAEMPKRGMFDTSIMKALSAGDEVEVRLLYKRPYTMESRAKLLFACNELPDSTDTTDGFFRRFIIIPFNGVFKAGMEGFDPFIDEKLEKELSGIFNRALRGYHRVCQQKKFSDSRASHSVMAQYKMDMDTAQTWFGECIEVLPYTGDKTIWVSKAEVYRDYADQMKEGNIRPLSSVDFGRKITKLIPDFKDRDGREYVEGKQVRVLYGLRFVSRRQA